MARRRDHRQELWQALNAADCLDRPMELGGAHSHVSMLLCLRRWVPTTDGRREFILPRGPIRLHRQVPVDARGRGCADPRGSSSAQGRIQRSTPPRIRVPQSGRSRTAERGRKKQLAYRRTRPNPASRARYFDFRLADVGNKLRSPRRQTNSISTATCAVCSIAFPAPGPSSTSSGCCRSSSPVTPRKQPATAGPDYARGRLLDRLRTSSGGAETHRSDSEPNRRGINTLLVGTSTSHRVTVRKTELNRCRRRHPRRARADCRTLRAPNQDMKAYTIVGTPEPEESILPPKPVGSSQWPDCAGS